MEILDYVSLAPEVAPAGWKFRLSSGGGTLRLWAENRAERTQFEGVFAEDECRALIDNRAIDTAAFHRMVRQALAAMSEHTRQQHCAQVWAPLLGALRGADAAETARAADGVGRASGWVLALLQDVVARSGAAMAAAATQEEAAGAERRCCHALRCAQSWVVCDVACRSGALFGLSLAHLAQPPQPAGTGQPPAPCILEAALCALACGPPHSPLFRHAEAGPSPARGPHVGPVRHSAAVVRAGDTRGALAIAFAPKGTPGEP